MDVADLVSRVRASGAAGITAADRAAFRYRQHEGRRLRSAIVDHLLPDFRAADLPLLRALTQEETQARTIHDGCGRVLYGLATMLYGLGELEDVLRIHAAKFSNMDAGTMIESYMLRIGRSEAEVTAFVRQRLAEQPFASSWPVARVLEDVRDAFASDDFEDRDACLENAFDILESTYAEDVLDEDPLQPD